MSRKDKKRKGFSCYSLSENGTANVDLPFHEIDESEEIGQVSLEHMLEAIEFVSDKGACMKAVEKGVVESESKPIYFLRCENYNAWKAADRLVSYWRERLEFFGNERAYRPMFDLSGNGALNEQDIEILKTGVFVELTQDNEGRSVMLLTAGRLSKEQLANVYSRIRVFFFMISWVALRHKMNQLSGIISMVLLTGNLTKQIGRDRNPEVRQVVGRLFQEAAPVKLHRLQPVLFPDPNSESIVEMFIINTLQIVNIVFSRYQKNFLLARKEECIRHDFERRGLKLEDFPASIGGKYDYNTHVNWVLDLQETSKASDEDDDDSDE